MSQTEGEGRCVEKNPLRDTDQLRMRTPSAAWTPGVTQEEPAVPGALGSGRYHWARLDPGESWKGNVIQVGLTGG